jgi:hypothetical protein
VEVQTKTNWLTDWPTDWLMTDWRLTDWWLTDWLMTDWWLTDWLTDDWLTDWMNEHQLLRHLDLTLGTRATASSYLTSGEERGLYYFLPTISEKYYITVELG